MKLSDKTCDRIITALIAVVMGGAWIADTYPKFTWPITILMALLCIGCGVMVVTRETRSSRENTK